MAAQCGSQECLSILLALNAEVDGANRVSLIAACIESCDALLHFGVCGIGTFVAGMFLIDKPVECNG